MLDYKSDRVAAEVDLEALVEREYALQRELYALAVLRGRGRSVEIVHWFLERPHEWVGAAIAAGERDALERLLAAPAARAAARLRRQPAPPPRAVPDLPGARAPVLLGRDRRRCAGAARTGASGMTRGAAEPP